MVKPATEVKKCFCSLFKEIWDEAIIPLLAITAIILFSAFLGYVIYDNVQGRFIKQRLSNLEDLASGSNQWMLDHLNHGENQYGGINPGQTWQCKQDSNLDWGCSVVTGDSKQLTINWFKGESHTLTTFMKSNGLSDSPVLWVGK